MTNDTDKHLHIHALADNDPSLPEAARHVPLDDPNLALQLQEIRLLKEMLRTAYPEQPTPPPRHRRVRLTGVPMLAIAAIVSLLSLALVGVLIRPQDRFTVQPVQLVGEKPNATQMVLFLDSAERAKFGQVLDVAEDMLRQQEMEINVVTSAGGLDMLRKATSPVAERILALSSRYETLRFYACSNTIAKLKREGQDAGMLENVNVKVSESAVDFVVRRLREGWQFIAI